jgi:Na+-transporting NADH:ubiquinone oxidoreductase subunit NqrA
MNLPLTAQDNITDVQTFIVIHLLTKIGTATNDAATSLKLLEKGLKKEDLALAVLIDFPFQILFGYLAARWSKGDKPLKPV